MQILTGLFPHQVLQRDRRDRATVIASGKTAARGPVHAVIQGLRGGSRPRLVGVARAGKFSVRLPGLPVGGPYNITLRCGDASLGVAGVRVGDVWILAGQSNMQGYGDLATGLRNAPGVYARTLAGAWGVAEEPMHVLEESPDPVHTAAPLSPSQVVQFRRKATLGAGPALPFAAELFRRTGVPQGLIACAHGGTSLLQWSPALKKDGGRSLYGSLFNIWKSIGQPVAGLLWYQGENDANAEHCEHYTTRFTALVKALRRDLRQPRLPVLTVQLGRVVGSGPAADRPWNRVQEQQAAMPTQLAHVGVVPAVDLPLSDNIHLSGAAQQRLGLRLARLASRLVYGDRREAEPPRIVRVRRLPQESLRSLARCIEVSFSGVVGQLHGLCERSFHLVDADHRVVDAIIRTERVKDRVLLWIWPNLTKPGARLVYGYGCNPAAMLADDRDFALPVTGPISIEGEMVPGPGFVAWAGGLTVHPTTLSALNAATATQLASQEPIRAGGEPWWPEFINQHQHWVGKSGVACFTTECDAPAAVNLSLGFGYDGPVRLWLDGREIHTNPEGTNPCVVDHYQIPVRLTAGRHQVTLAIDVNGGCAWGFTLRWLAPRPCRWPVPLIVPARNS